MKIIIGNWKAYIDNYADAKKLLELYKKLAQGKKAAFVVAPPNIYLHSLRRDYKGKLLNFASQSLGFDGACTGCVSASQLANDSVAFALIGHSEQRARGLDDAGVAKRVAAAVKEGVFPIIIVGEPKRDKDAGHYRYVQKQILEALREYPKNKPLKFMLAYEPIWAVGAKRPAKAQEIEMMMIYIRKTLAKLFGERKAKSVPLIYGGSVNPLNISSILSLQSTDGVLLGRASVSESDLLEIVSKL